MSQVRVPIPSGSGDVMPRNMSFSMTTEAIRAGSKTVTRRLGWYFLKPGDVLWAVEKGMGLKKGEKVKRICLIRVVSVKREPLNKIGEYGQAECDREGFPELAPWQFVSMFIDANGLGNLTYSPSSQVVNRVEFEYVGEQPSAGSGIMDSTSFHKEPPRARTPGA